MSDILKLFKFYKMIIRGFCSWEIFVIILRCKCATIFDCVYLSSRFKRKATIKLNHNFKYNFKLNFKLKLNLKLKLTSKLKLKISYA